MKFAHNITITVFCKDYEDKDLIKSTLVSLLPLDIEKEKIEVQSQEAEGFDEKKINIFKIQLIRQPHIRTFWANLKEKLGTQVNILKQQLDSRLDEACNFFIRLDKEKLYKGTYLITDSGNCYHIRLTIASYPKNRESARRVLLELLNQPALHIN